MFVFLNDCYFKEEKFMRWILIFLFFIGIFLVVLPVSKAEGAIYWHFTFQAQKDQEEEWLWVTFKEVPKSTAFQSIEQKVKSMGGKGIQGALLVQTRAKAWRGAFRSEEGIRCDTYIPSYGRDIKYWNASWSNWVFCDGQVFPLSGEEKERLGFPGYFNIGLKRSSDVSKILAQERRFLDISESPGEKLKGSFNLYSMEYQDPLVHYEDTCRDKKWAKHFRSLFMNSYFNSLRFAYLEVGKGFSIAQIFEDTVITYSLYRSHSPQHRFFGRKITNFNQVRENEILNLEEIGEILVGDPFKSSEEIMVFTLEEVETEVNEEEMMVFTEEETNEYGEEDMVFTPEEIDLLEEEGLEVIQDEEAVMDFTEEELEPTENEEGFMDFTEEALEPTENDEAVMEFTEEETR